MHRIFLVVAFMAFHCFQSFAASAESAESKEAQPTTLFRQSFALPEHPNPLDVYVCGTCHALKFEEQPPAFIKVVRDLAQLPNVTLVGEVDPTTYYEIPHHEFDLISIARFNEKLQNDARARNVTDTRVNDPIHSWSQDTWPQLLEKLPSEIQTLLAAWDDNGDLLIFSLMHPVLFRNLLDFLTDGAGTTRDDQGSMDTDIMNLFRPKPIVGLETAIQRLLATVPGRGLEDTDLYLKTLDFFQQYTPPSIVQPPLNLQDVLQCRDLLRFHATYPFLQTDNKEDLSITNTRHRYWRERLTEVLAATSRRPTQDSSKFGKNKAEHTPTVLVVVGAAHLGGDTGLLEILHTYPNPVANLQQLWTNGEWRPVRRDFTFPPDAPAEDRALYEQLRALE